jgi:hypothetical protein
MKDMTVRKRERVSSAAGRRFKAALAAAVFALVLTGCSSGNGGSDNEDDDPAVPSPAGTVTKTLVYATAGTKANTQSLTLVFSADMGELTASNIDLEALGGVNEGITWDAPERTEEDPLVYRLPVSGISNEGKIKVSVTKNNAPVPGSPKTIWVHYGAQVVNFAYLEADGVSNTTKTRTLTLTFGGGGINLQEEEICLNPHSIGNESIGVKQGTLQDGPTVYTIGVEGIVEEGDVTVTIEKEGYTTNPRTVTVHCPAAPTGVFSNGLEEGGSAIDLIRAASEEGLSSIEIQLAPGDEPLNFDNGQDIKFTNSLTHNEPPDFNILNHPRINSPPQVIIDGGGRVLRGSQSFNILNVGWGVTLTLRNITLVGTGSDATLVSVSTNGHLILETGAVIRDHNNQGGYGGGVVVYAGTLTMKNGSVISGNTSYDEGGGVYVYGGGEFIMEGGTISGNTASRYGGGGSGVAVDGGTFTMKSGIISGNTAQSGSGGVYVYGGGEFIMEGGTISGNTSNSYGGGGVAVNDSGTFTMRSGIISGNTANNSSGGGVYVYGSGTFIMEGGIIRNNNAGYGGGVLVSGTASTFTKNGSSVIYGTEQYSTFQNIASNKGHAVYFMKGSSFSAGDDGKRDATADLSVNMSVTSGTLGNGWEPVQ